MTKDKNSDIQNDILWDEITSIEHVGLRQTYDFHIPETHNFLANEIVVHNSGGIEECSDVVLLIWAEENVLSVYLRKNRHGITGKVLHLDFDFNTLKLTECDYGI